LALHAFVDHEFTVRQISEMMNVSVRTIERRMQLWNLSIHHQYSSVSEADLCAFVTPLLAVNPALDW
jgi:predicted DNA-binding transcriptional regulator YafY